MAGDGRTTTYDIVQFGATGFAGLLTAEYLARHAPPGLRWALAGRSQAKLEDVAAKIAVAAPDRAAPELIEVALDDAPALEALAAQAKVIVTTIGPFVLHGEALVAAAAKTGADYLDITGEQLFVDRMYLRYHDPAVASGSRLIHCAGFDSVPHDLGALFTARRFPGDAPLRITGAVRANAEFSGGTFQSAVGIIGQLGATASTAKERRRKEAAARTHTRKAKPVQGRPRRDPDTGRWLGPLPTIDPQIVVRTADVLPDYGPDFTYEHTMSAKRIATIGALGLGAGSLVVATRIPPLRKALLKVKAAGTGPSEARRAKSWFTVRFRGESAGRVVVTEVRGGDPGYDETAKMLAESALALVSDDDVPARAGQLTTGAAIGDALLRRLPAAGIEFKVLSDSAAQAG